MIYNVGKTLILRQWTPISWPNCSSHLHSTNCMNSFSVPFLLLRNIPEDLWSWQQQKSWTSCQNDVEPH